MSYLLEALGRGLLGDLRCALERQLPSAPEDDAERLRARLAQSPASLDLAMRLGMVQLREMHLADARRVFETAMTLAGSRLQPALGLACVYDEMGRLDRSLRYLDIAQAHDPKDPAIAFAIGFCEERLGRRAAAKASYARALRLCPQLRNAYERLAAIAICEGDPDSAIEQYERLAELEPGDPDVPLTLGGLYLRVARASDAAERFERALLIEPETGDGALHDADHLVQEGRLAEAIDLLERLVQKYPGVAAFHVHLGDLYVRIGNDARAVEQYHAALEQQPGFLEATVKLGTQHLRARRYVDAAQTFNRAVELNDRLMIAFVGLGIAQRVCGRENESRATLDVAASLEPSSTLLYSEAARLQLKSEAAARRNAAGGATPRPADAPGEDDLATEALRRHRQALFHAPNDSDLHYRYGLLLRQVGRCEQAIGAFRSAVTINPDYSKALVKLGLALREIDQSDEAMTSLRRALELNPAHVDAHYQLALLFAQRSRFDLAVEEFDAEATSGANPSLRANLALALQAVGMVDRAGAVWRSICELPAETELDYANRERVLRGTEP